MVSSDWDVVLRDGTTVRLRPLIPADREALHRFLDQLSPESIYFRFFNPRPAREAIDGLLAGIAGATFAFVAEVGGAIVALAQYSRLDSEPTAAEAAFLVADSMQGRGIGTRLLEHLADHARENGIARFHAWVMGGNHRMLQVFIDSGFAVESKSDQGVIEVSLSLAPSDAHDARNAARATVAAHASLNPFFAPASVAIVGANRERGGIGAEILNNLRTTGYRGDIFPVHPTAASVQDLKAYARLGDIPTAVDLAIVAVPAARVLDIARDAAVSHVKAIIVISAGFSESGGDARLRELELLEIVRGAGMRLIGPNCMGVLNTDPAVLLNATFSPVFPTRGRVAFSTQSGALGLAILEYARRINVGLSTFASIGNKADVSSNDLIQYWADDSNTSVILLYLESFGNPRRFARLAREVGRRKPIVAVKAGRSKSGARAAHSHTGALAANDTIVDALFRHAGVIRATTIEEMFDVAIVLERQPLPTGRRVAILTNAGGPGILAADACEARGLTMAGLGDRTIGQLREFLPPAAGLGNPVDMLATATARHYHDAMAVLLDDDNVDALLTIFIPPLVTAADDVARSMQEVSLTARKPILAAFIGQEGAVPLLGSIPTYRFPEAAVTALWHAVRYAEWRMRDAGRVPEFASELAEARRILAECMAGGEGWLTPLNAQRVLEAMHIPVTNSYSAGDVEAAVQRASEVGYPVALKAVVPGVLHKTDVGGVKLNLANEAALRNAFTELQMTFGDAISETLVQRMAGSGVEMFVGGLQDPAFGPVVFCGSGGIFVELFQDVACRLAPLTDRDARDLLGEVRGIARLRGFRGAARGDEEALGDTVLRVGALLDACPEILELDINPVLVRPEGVSVLDVRIRVGVNRPPPPRRWVRY
jgi:acetyl coenzyme A synthetase (ADP forming)-like protein